MIFSQVGGCKIESVQDFLIKLGIKPLMHLLEKSNFSLNDVIQMRTLTPKFGPLTPHLIPDAPDL